MKYEFDADYKKMYMKLFNAVTDGINEMERKNFLSAKFILLKAQADCEEMFMGDAEDETEEVN